jgi:hypothetical protein
MENKRTADKVRMLRKINANYNRSTIINPVAANSIESYIQSQEENNNENKKGFIKTIIDTVKTLFKKILNLIKIIFNKIVNFFKRRNIDHAKLKNPSELKKLENKKRSNEDVSSYDQSIRLVNFKKVNTGHIHKIIDRIKHFNKVVSNQKYRKPIEYKNSVKTIEDLFEKNSGNSIMDLNENMIMRNYYNVNYISINDYIQTKNNLQDIKKCVNSILSIREKIFSTINDLDYSLSKEEKNIYGTQYKDGNEFRMEKDLINKYRSFGLFVRFIVQIGGKIVNLTNYVIYS